MAGTFEERLATLKRARMHYFLFSALFSVSLYFLLDEVIGASGFALEGQSLLFLRFGLPLIFPLFAGVYFLLHPAPGGGRKWRRVLGFGSLSVLFPALVLFFVCFHRSWGNPIYWVGAGYLAALACQVLVFAGLALDSDPGPEGSRQVRRELSFLLAGLLAGAALGLYTAGPLLFKAEHVTAGGLLLSLGSEVLLPSALLSIAAYAIARFCSPERERGLRFVVAWALSLASLAALLPMGSPALKFLGALVLMSVSVQAPRRFFPILGAAGIAALSPAWIPAALALLMRFADDSLPVRKTARRVVAAAFYALSILFVLWGVQSHFAFLAGGLREAGTNLLDISLRPFSGLFFYFPVLLAGFFFLGERSGRDYFLAAFFAGLAAVVFRVGSQSAEETPGEILPYGILLLPGLRGWLDRAGLASRRFAAALSAGWTLSLSVLALVHFPMAYIGVSEDGPLSRALPNLLDRAGGAVDSRVVSVMALVALVFVLFYCLDRRRDPREGKRGELEAAVVLSIAVLVLFQYQVTESAGRRSRVEAAVPVSKEFKLSQSHPRESITIPFPGRRWKEILLLSSLAHSQDVEQGAWVGVLSVRAEGGRSFRFPIRAGLETAEWSFDRKGVSPAVRHRRPRVGSSMPRPGTMGGRYFRGYDYVASFQLPEKSVVQSVDFEWTLPAVRGDSASFFARAIRLIEDSP